MKLALDRNSVQALRQLADALPKASADIAEETLRLISVYQNLSDRLGAHRESFHGMLMHVRQAQLTASEALEALPAKMYLTAEKIEQYLSSQQAEADLVLSGRTLGTDGTPHDHRTVVQFSQKPDGLPAPVSFRCDQQQARAWGIEHYAGWMASLSEQERAAVMAYSGAEYGELNRKLRAGVSLEPRENTLQENIHSALSKASLPEDIQVYRALPEHAVRELALFCAQDSVAEGVTLQDSAFMSCSLVSDNRFVRSHENKYIFRMSAPAGVHAAYIGGLSFFESEQEILVDGNHSIYITGVSKCPRSQITGHANDTDEIVVIDGVLTV